MVGFVEPADTGGVSRRFQRMIDAGMISPAIHFRTLVSDFESEGKQWHRIPTARLARTTQPGQLWWVDSQNFRCSATRTHATCSQQVAENGQPFTPTIYLAVHLGSPMLSGWKRVGDQRWATHWASGCHVSLAYLAPSSIEDALLILEDEFPGLSSHFARNGAVAEWTGQEYRFPLGVSGYTLPGEIPELSWQAAYRLHEREAREVAAMPRCPSIVQNEALAERLHELHKQAVRESKPARPELSRALGKCPSGVRCPECARPSVMPAVRGQPQALSAGQTCIAAGESVFSPSQEMSCQSRHKIWLFFAFGVMMGGVCSTAYLRLA